MRDEPNVELRCQTTRASDTINGVYSFRQQDGGHGSRNPLRSVLQLTCRMNHARKIDGAPACDRYSTNIAKVMQCCVGGRGGCVEALGVNLC